MSFPELPRDVPEEGFRELVERARAEGRLRIDLTESDPSRCNLGWGAGELDAILDAQAAAAPEPPAARLAAARAAVASYLAGHGASVPPERVLLVPSGKALRAMLRAVPGSDGEILVPSPGPALHGVATELNVKLRSYPLRYDGTWRLDRKPVVARVTRHAKALLVGNPSEPAGAILSPEDLEFLEGLCAERRIALLGEEGFADTALAPCATVAQATRCLAIHVSGLGGACGLPRLGAGWLVVAGPQELAEPALSVLGRMVKGEVPPPIQRAIPALLARRERFLSALRTRLAQNRSALATAALREAPWSLQWGRGGCWAVLQIGSAQEDRRLCRALLEDGVAVQPGSLYGLPDRGCLVVSLLPTPEVFLEGLSTLEHRLRQPLF